MSIRLSTSPNSQVTARLETATQTENSSIATTQGKTGQGTPKLPYHLDQQVELLHLRADVEALLQQLQCIKQQRHHHRSSTALH